MSTGQGEHEGNSQQSGEHGETRPPQDGDYAVEEPNTESVPPSGDTTGPGSGTSAPSNG